MANRWSELLLRAEARETKSFGESTMMSSSPTALRTDTPLRDAARPAHRKEWYVHPHDELKFAKRLGCAIKALCPPSPVRAFCA